ncbi:integumentary mucin C.1 [Drosophila rhopaloa]|uniref:Integumentary mucin C.1 n=1 Tax=Drosophila rhopaloa TaxID=1041015 RepID=A0A6P4EMS3_DRORH|nr:integumentary mucin C.1 [Drosophila rhopaloa]XP_016979511.1 integumentary mucin C.1 [Drosophila rhopaloa]
MKSAVEISLIFIWFLVAGIWAQDTIPEIPVDYMPTTTTRVATTLATSTEEQTTPTTESTTTTTTDPTTTSTLEHTTSTITDPITTSTTEHTTTSTTVPTTTATTEPTTTSTTKSTTTSSTHRAPINPTYRPPHVQPTYTSKKPWVVMEPVERCFLRNQLEFSTCWQNPPTTSCYRCCYYYDSHIIKCNKLHHGPCGWYDRRQLKVHVNWKQV